ncbi:MAG: DUF4336 domain-containing protein [Alphaproteobacteria bacterium]|nr:DUF4336 domain-containing protein [Alphaproteobacteria bacterium]
MSLTPLAPDVWTIDGHHVLPGGVWFPVRATVIRLPDGGLWIHSPLAFTPEDAAAIDALGPVRHLVAPSLLHHLWLGDAAARWPGAAVWGPAGLDAKRPDLTLTGTLDAPAPWDDVIARRFLDGMPACDETVFFHRPSGTLMVTDLVFAVHEAPSWKSRLLFRMVGTWRRMATSRSMLVLARDKAALGAACRDVLAWPIARVVPCHGRVADTDAHATLARALAWLVRRAPPRIAARHETGHPGSDGIVPR